MRRLPGVVDRAPRSLRKELAALGIAGFYTPRANDLDLMKRLRTMVPPLFVPDHPDGTAARR